MGMDATAGNRRPVARLVAGNPCQPYIPILPLPAVGREISALPGRRRVGSVASQRPVAENFPDRGTELALLDATIQATTHLTDPAGNAIAMLLAEVPHGVLASLAQLVRVIGTKLAEPLVLAALIGAVGLVFLMQPGKKALRLGGSVLALGAFATMLAEVLKRAGGSGDSGIPPVFPVVFGVLALCGAVRMITHPRPVFAALYFILVVVATAGMFLLLGAEFMAFSLVIVYAGAILITYMFVLMLAQQSPVDGSNAAWYDRMPREAVSAVVVGFMMVAMLTDAFFSPGAQSTRSEAIVANTEAGAQAAWKRLESMPKLLLETARSKDPAISEVVVKDGVLLGLDGVNAFVHGKLADGSIVRVELDPSGLPDNGRQVGVDLVSKYPAGLEIAGVVLLMALFGAVILARKQIELGEDERRGIAGMRRLTVDGEAGGLGGTR